MKQFHRSLYQHRPFEPVPIKMKLSDEEVARFYVNQYQFPGVIIRASMLRDYPLENTTSDVVGYVGRINQRELQQIDPINYSTDGSIGKVGIEKYYEKILHGTIGLEEAETNASGHIVRILKKTPPIPGNDVYLTIDSNLQAAAEKALGNESGAIVVMQPSTGQILALVTSPSYNPNPF